MAVAVSLWSAGADLYLTRAEGPGDQVVVVYNSRLAESKALADYYAEKRAVPANQVFGFDLPASESISRADFRQRLQEPLLRRIIDEGLIIYRTEIIPATREKPGEVVRQPKQARIRYVVLCYGVPLVIQSDGSLKEADAEKLPAAFRRNEAAVDSELALLPLSVRSYPLVGPLRNPFYETTTPSLLRAANGVLMVTRLDGPTAAIARGLVDKALQAERDGLWGRAYFDARGLTNTHYKLGDDWIRAAAQVVRRQGFETVLDEAPATFPAGFPMSQIGFYAGWYTTHVTGPWARADVEVMPGAVAYHLHSFSAQTLRSATTHWVGPFLAKGVTATLGCVAEPYLDHTPNVGVFFDRLVNGRFSFGEAAYAAIPSLSWQTTVVGDPLYRPFGKLPQVQHAELLERHSPLIEWSHLRVVNLNLVTDTPPEPLVDYLRQEPLTRHSAVLMEKLGDLYLTLDRPADGIAAYTAALGLNPTPWQGVRLRLALGRALTAQEQYRQAIEVYEQLLAKKPDYPDPDGIYRRLLPLAQKLGWEAKVEQYERELARASRSGTGP